MDHCSTLHGHRSVYSCARCVWVMPGDIWLSGQISQSCCLSISSWYAANQANISTCIYNAIFRCYRCCFLRSRPPQFGCQRRHGTHSSSWALIATDKSPQDQQQQASIGAGVEVRAGGLSKNCHTWQPSSISYVNLRLIFSWPKKRLAKTFQIIRQARPAMRHQLRS